MCIRDSDYTDGSSVSEVANLEHHTADVDYNSIIKISGNTYALAYTDADGDGWIQTFTISSDGATITEVASYEHNTADGTHHSWAQVDDDTFVLAYASSANMGKISTHNISADGATIDGNLVKYEHETVAATYNSLVKVDDDTFALAYTGGGDDGFIQTFTIPANGTTITKVANLEHNTSDATHNSLVKVDHDTFALAYSGIGDDGFIKTFTINSDGTSGAVIGSKLTEVTELEHNTSDGTHNSLVKVDDDTVALAYASTSDVGNIATFTITSDGATITEVYDVEHDSSQAKSNSLIKMDDETFALAYMGEDDDGFIQTFTISGTASSSTSGGGSNSCDSNGIWGTNSSLRVYEVSYNAESYEVQVQAYSTCGGISAIMSTSGQQDILSLSPEQSLLDQNIAIYSGYLDSSNESFRIMLENDRHSFDKIFYVHGESLNEKYTGTTGYTSEQQGKPVQIEVLPETKDGISQITEQELYNEPELLPVASEVLPADPEPFEPEPLELEPPEPKVSLLNFDFIWNIFSNIFS